MVFSSVCLIRQIQILESFLHSLQDGGGFLWTTNKSFHDGETVSRNRVPVLMCSLGGEVTFLDAVTKHQTKTIYINAHFISVLWKMVHFSKEGMVVCWKTNAGSRLVFSFLNFISLGPKS